MRPGPRRPRASDIIPLLYRAELGDIEAAIELIGIVAKTTRHAWNRARDRVTWRHWRERRGVQPPHFGEYA